MAKLPILHFPNPRLRIKAKPVSVVDDSIRTLADDMLETMYEAPGIGLAATQVDRHLRMLVLDISEDKSAPMVFINPVLTPLTDECVPYEEGCLSVPGSYDEVQRPARVRVNALDRDGKPFSLDADGLLAVCLQHEVDHLDGKLFVDYLSPLKRQRIQTKLQKLQKQRA
jgi:peptide deformylase